ncbi:MAG TPA: hypothetical protein VK638_50670, partial [Edaphobacter sp.]|nr:hypothetical protein [Edaphobacter sp.]
TTVVCARAYTLAMGKMLAMMAILLLAGCQAKPGSTLVSQRFVLIPNPSNVNKNIPEGALALDTKTGQLCYTVGGPFTSESPAMDLCADLFQRHS